MESNANPDANTILLPQGTYMLSHPHFPGAPESAGGSLRIEGSVRIEGAGVGRTVVSGAGLAPRLTVFAVWSGASVLSGLTIRDGGGVAHYGGGIFVARDATLILERVSITDNTVVSWGAGLSNHGTVTLLESTVSDNRAGVGRPELVPYGFGGGIFNDSTGRMTIDKSTVSANTAGYSGGGIENLGRLSISNSTISGNEVPEPGGGGGGLHNSGSGLRVRGAVTLSSVTISANRSAGSTAGGVHSIGPMRATNSIIAGNTHTGGSTPDCSHASTAPLESGGYNLIGDVAGCTFVGSPAGHVVGDPRLSALADHGGPTATHSLLPGSPAIDRGHPSSCPREDQRGRTRTGRCDIGSFERLP
jgi:hypothetical protein